MSTPVAAARAWARTTLRGKGAVCPPKPSQPRRIRPSLISRPATNWAVWMGIAKQIPWAGRITAVFTPTTSPRDETRGPPELPGFRAASVWIRLSMSRPPCARSDRPSALTTPAVTEHSKPRGLPMATTSWPGRSVRESPRRTAGRSGAWRRITARSVSGSSPASRAGRERPSGSRTSILRAPCTTWLFVRANPSGVRTKPEPEPRLGSVTSMFTTDGATASTAWVTAREYASRRPTSPSAAWDTGKGRIMLRQ